MPISITRFSLFLALFCAASWAQDAPIPAGGDATDNRATDGGSRSGAAKQTKDAGKKAAAKKDEAKDEAKKDANEPETKDAKKKQASAGTEKKPGSRVVSADEEKVKVLKPKDVPTELTRLKTKADIKAEVTVLPLHGREVTVKGVIRNGKLIERFVGRRFVPQKDLENVHSGVRLWWVEGSDGWIFIRYSQIKEIALTGRLTAEEKRKILEALKARKNGDKGPEKADETSRIVMELEKMTPEELEAFLLRTYPSEQGWTRKKLRELKRKEIVEAKPLAREEAVFVKYFTVLIKARLKELKRTSKKIKFEPGSEKDDAAEAKPGADKRDGDDDDEQPGDDGR